MRLDPGDPPPIPPEPGAVKCVPVPLPTEEPTPELAPLDPGAKVLAVLADMIICPSSLVEFLVDLQPTDQETFNYPLNPQDDGESVDIPQVWTGKLVNRQKKQKT